MTETVLEMPAAADLELTQVLQALSDPVRLEIVDALAAGGEQACGAMPLPVSASTRSHHFRILRDAVSPSPAPSATSDSCRCGATISSGASRACSTQCSVQSLNMRCGLRCVHGE